MIERIPDIATTDYFSFVFRYCFVCVFFLEWSIKRIKKNLLHMELMERLSGLGFQN